MGEFAKTVRGKLRPDRSRIREAFTAEADAAALWSPVAFGIGIAFYFSLPGEPHLFFGPFAMLAAGLGLWRVRGRGVKILLAGLMLAAAGFTLARVHTLVVDHPVIGRETGPVSVEAVIESAEPASETGNVLRLILERPQIAGLSPQETPPRVRVSVRTDAHSTEPGTRVETLAVLIPPAPPVWPGGFDFARAAFFDRLGAVGYTVASVRVLEEAEMRPGLSARIQAMRQAIAGRMHGVIGGGEGAVAGALVTGLRAAIPDDVSEAMRAAGLAHLLAISGLHMALVAGFLFFAVRAGLAAIPAVALRFPIRKIAALAAWAGALAYLMIAGGAVPVTRAFLMASVVILAILTGRRAVSLRTVALAALVILVLEPAALLSAGFQMSFAAVVALVAGYRALEPWLVQFRRGGGIVRLAGLYLLTIAISTVIAELTIGPIAAFHFNRMAAYGLIANLAAVPLMGFWVMPMLMIGVILMPLGLDAWALTAAGWGLAGIIGTAEWTTSLPGAEILVAKLPGAFLPLFGLGLAWLALWKAWALARWGLLPIGAAILLGLAADRPDMLVSPAGLVAYHEADEEVYLNTLRRERFVREQWLRHLGERKARPLQGHEEYICDDAGCLLRVEQEGRSWQLALPQNPMALAADCARADLIIAPFLTVPLACEAPVIDRRELRTHGVHALTFTAEGIEIARVSDARGTRPWTRAGHSR